MSPNNGPEGSGRRWWEIGGGRAPEEGRYGDLVTGGRARSRPERSLSAGADPTDEPRPPFRGFLWPVVSVVAVGALILFVVYLVPMGKSESPETTRSPVAAAPGSGRDDVGGQPLAPPGPLDSQPGIAGDALPPLGGAEGVPGGPVGDSGDVGNAGAQPTGRPTSTLGAPASVPRVTVNGPAPAAPGPQQGGPPVPGTGGCTGIGDTGEYACTVTQPAPVYLAGTTEPRGPLPADRYRFLCQSDGSRYSVANRTNHWWAWVGNSKVGAWVPVVFLAGGPDNAAVPGLPVCETPTVKSTTTPTP